MSLHDQYGAEEEEEKEVDDDELSSSEDDEGFEEDMESLKEACMRTGTNFNDLRITAADNDRPSTSDAAVEPSAVSEDSGSEDERELLRSIRNHFALSEDVCEPLSMKPLCALPPISSDDDAEDDYETLRVIQKRFLAYSTNDTWKNSTEDHVEKTEPTCMTSRPLEDATCNNICERFLDYEKAGNVSHFSSGNAEMQPVALVQWDQSDANELSTVTDKFSRFPKSAQLLIDAIKKNRSYQKFLRSKLTQIEAKIEANKKLKERIKILRDFQVSCKKITGRALSMKKDLRIQLISATKSRTSKDHEVNDKKVTADYGPPENSSVSNYIMALTKFPLILQRKKWSSEERENLEKGIRQQFQETALQVSVDWLSSDGLSGDGSNLDNIIATVKDLEITPERIREFLPKVNWDQLASLYVKGRSGAECETRWLNHEDPLINRNPWTAEEDKNLLFVVQEKGIGNWFDIAVSLGSNRTPFQCLARYQRSLNACILKKEWTEEEDDQLRIAVEVFGECDWQSVASTLKGRTGAQCSNRWTKSLHPTRQRVGRWTRDEDKCLKVAVMLFGPKNWRKIAEVVPGRTQVQCRERWVNSLNPALNLGIWTKEEDQMLEAAIKEHGYCWSKIAACMPSRTDNQCWRRWKVLHPKEVPLLQEARRIRKATLISNFVDRESERPALGLNDFIIPLPMITTAPEPQNANLPSKEKRKQRRRKSESEKVNDEVLRHLPEKERCKSSRKGAQACFVEVPGIINDNGAETASGCDGVTKKRRNPHSENNNCSEPADNVAFPKKRKRKLPSGNNNYTESAGTAAKRKKRRKPPSGHTDSCDRMQDDAVQREKSEQRSESNKCIESMQDNSSCHPLSAFCMTTDIEAESFGSSLARKRKKNPKPSTKQCSKRRVHTELGEEQNSVCSENSVFSGGTGGAEMMQNSVVDDAFRKKSTAKPGSKRKTSMNLSTSQSSRITDAEGFESLSSNKNSRKRENSTPRQHSRKRKSNEPSGDEDDISLASFLRYKLKKRISSVTDNPKKIRLDIVESAHLSTVEGVDQCSKKNQMRFGLQRCDGVIPEKSTFQSRLKQASDTDIGVIDAIDEVVRKASRMDEEDNLQADDISLACLRKRLKKRRLIDAQSGNQGTSSCID